jgi:hypothetical protein
MPMVFFQIRLFGKDYGFEQNSLGRKSANINLRGFVDRLRPGFVEGQRSKVPSPPRWALGGIWRSWLSFVRFVFGFQYKPVEKERKVTTENDVWCQSSDRFGPDTFGQVFG